MSDDTDLTTVYMYAKAEANDKIRELENQLKRANDYGDEVYDRLKEAETENQRLTNRVVALSERVHQLKCEDKK